MTPVSITTPLSSMSEQPRLFADWFDAQGLDAIHGVTPNTPVSANCVVVLSTGFHHGAMTLNLSFTDPSMAMLFKLTFGGTQA